MGTEGESAEAAPGGAARLVAGRYRLEARLGRGGMGVVWRATDLLLGRPVAVKELLQDDTLPAGEARRQRERTLREARAVARLRHPHIVVVHDVVEDGDRPYLVMELVEGGSLADRVADRGPVDVREAARIGLALLGALRTAHAAGVLHRDVKPSNVLLDDDGRVVLTDFGVARVEGATTLTERGGFVGSPEYTAPERMSGAGGGPASDLWSLGALLCTALSGRSPFHRDSLGGVLHAVVTDEIRPPVQAGPLLPVVRGLLERDPERRLGAAEAEELLRTFLDTGRVPQPPARTPVRTPARLTPVPALPLRPSARAVLVAALLVTAMAGVGVSAVALLVHRDGAGGGGTPTTPAPRPSVRTSASAPATTPTPAPPTSFRPLSHPPAKGTVEKGAGKKGALGQVRVTGR